MITFIKKNKNNKIRNKNLKEINIRMKEMRKWLKINIKQIEIMLQID